MINGISITSNATGGSAAGRSILPGRTDAADTAYAGDQAPGEQGPASLADAMQASDEQSLPRGFVAGAEEQLPGFMTVQAGFDVVRRNLDRQQATAAGDDSATRTAAAEQSAMQRALLAGAVDRQPGERFAPDADAEQGLFRAGAALLNRPVEQGLASSVVVSGAAHLDPRALASAAQSGSQSAPRTQGAGASASASAPAQVTPAPLPTRATALLQLMGEAAALGGAPREVADTAFDFQARSVETSAPGLLTSRPAIATVPEWAPVRVDNSQAHWARELMAALAERVEMQISQQIKEARIRLDPPELGRLQLTVRLDGDRLSVHLNASHAQTREALQHQQERLRADLAGEYGHGVEVTVGQEERHRQPGEPLFWNESDIAGNDTLSADGAGAPEHEQRDTQTWVSTLA